MLLVLAHFCAHHKHFLEYERKYREANKEKLSSKASCVRIPCIHIQERFNVLKWIGEDGALHKSAARGGAK